MTLKRNKFIFLIIVLFSYASCETNNDLELNEINSNSINQSVTDLQSVYNAFAFADFILIDKFNNYASCFEVSKDSSNNHFSHTIKLNSQFDCRIISPNNSKGELKLDYETKYLSLFKTINLTFNQFECNGNKYNGKLSYVFKSISPSIRLVEITLDSLFATQEKNTRRLHGTLNISIINKENTISGQIISSLLAENYQLKINEDLKISNDYINSEDMNHFYFSQGITEFSNSSIKGKIHYGFDGEYGERRNNILAIFQSNEGKRFGIELPLY